MTHPQPLTRPNEASSPQTHHRHLPDATVSCWVWVLFCFTCGVESGAQVSPLDEATKGTHESIEKAQTPEKNNSKGGERFLETLFGVLLATRLCLSHAWPRPRGPAAFPPGPATESGGSRKVGWPAPSPCARPHPALGPREETGLLKHSQLVGFKSRRPGPCYPCKDTSAQLGSAAAAGAGSWFLPRESHRHGSEGQRAQYPVSSTRLSPAPVSFGHPNPPGRGSSETRISTAPLPGRSNTAKTCWGRNTCGSWGAQSPTLPQPGTLPRRGEEGENKGCTL